MKTLEIWFIAFPTCSNLLSERLPASTNFCVVSKIEPGVKSNILEFPWPKLGGVPHSVKSDPPLSGSFPSFV